MSFAGLNVSAGVSLNAAIGTPFAVGGNVGIGFNAGVNMGAFTTQTQSFQTIPLPNSNLALYRITINAPGGSQQATDSWTFPISPQNIKRRFTALTNVYDVAGPSTTNGVTRVVDMYGNTPVSFGIRGTTGWQYHSTDNFQYTGMASIAFIVQALNKFAAYNASQLQNNNSDLYTMQFFDYFYNDFWQVVPMGPQEIEQDAQRPLLFYYNFNFAGVKNLNDPIQQDTNDPVANDLSVSSSQAISSLNTSISSTLSNYESDTAGAIGDD